jgi:hypothetical protein
MPDIIRRNDRALAIRPGRAGGGLPARTSRALQAIDHRTLVRIADVSADEIVQGEKLRAIDHLTTTAMYGQAMLAHVRDSLAGADIELHDELRFFTEIAKMGKGEILVRTLDCFSRDC